MALRGLTLPSAGSLGDLDLLADSELDLSSWLFQDDLYQQDFGKGAKDMHPISSAVADHVSPSFITSQDFPDWMEASFDINWDHPLKLEECLNNDIKQQMQQQQQQTSSYELSTKFTEHLFEDPIPPLQVSTPEQQPEYQRVLVLKNDINDVAYSDDDLSSSEGFDDSSTSFNASQESVSVCEEEEPFQLCASPFIISVPLTDVFAEQKPPTFKTINVTGIERINVAQKPVFCSTPIQSVAVSLPPNERREPQKIVINLRRVTLPVTNSCAPDVNVLPTVQPLPQNGPTLKEALTMDDADDFIRDMVSMPTVVPAQPFEADRRNDSVLQSSEDFEDSGFAVGFGSPSELLLYSPSSSSELSSDCGSVHSPEPYDDHSSKDDAMEENLLNRNRSSSSCGESPRYAPYKSLEKKMRKKEQNKRAALRYRQKKKEEEDSVLGTLQAEEEKQKQLNEKYNALQMEVKLMKKLMREVLVKKGILKN